MSAELDSASQLDVFYYCPCTGCMRTTDAPAEVNKQQPHLVESLKEESKAPLDANTQQQLAILRTWPIEKLYYCDDCSEVRCPRCVVEEPAGYHCPNCLFDVPTASVRSEKNCCARNCFQCPVCTHVLTVVEGESSQNDGGRSCYTLSCAVCMWDSREIGWEFEKPTGISAQIERMRAGEPAAKEYASLLDYWRTVQRTSAAAASTAGSHSLTSSVSFKHRLAAAGAHGGPTSVDSLPPYNAACYVDSDAELPEGFKTLEDASVIPFASDLRNKEPQRIRLHMKMSRRCRICHHILIKPEPKAQATRFKIQLMAANFLPTITLPNALPAPKGRGLLLEHLNTTPLQVGSTASIVLRFANPLYTEMDVSVDAGDLDAAQTDILAPRFTLPPFAELWEYDEDEDEDGSASPGAPTSGKGGSKRGIIHRHGNRIAIQLDVTPRAQTDKLTIPLHITCTHLDDMADIDTSSSNSPRRIVNEFWAYVSLGNVC
ncbi:hypothetical protein IWW50_000350 [Coemansia erecta]|nr:hypothetical protein GGF43_000460 [Coemansia sp. RSA 2618]KAJ2830317.1 hypothetical protein IWW50_000350 [Coemansia erecta]